MSGSAVAPPPQQCSQCGQLRPHPFVFAPCAGNPVAPHLHEYRSIPSSVATPAAVAGCCSQCSCMLTRDDLEESKENDGYGLGLDDKCPAMACQHPVSSHQKREQKRRLGGESSEASEGGAASRTPPPPFRSTPPSNLSPLKVATDGRPDEALTVLSNMSNNYPVSSLHFHTHSVVQAGIRNGTDTNAVWALLHQVHHEWSSKFHINQALVDTANRRETVSSILSCIDLARTMRVAVCRLFAGVRGIGKTTLLQLTSIVSKIAFGDDNLLVVYHDFNQNGRGYNRHSLVSIFREAIKSRWNLTDAQLDQRLTQISGMEISKVIEVCTQLGREQNPAVKITVVLFADELQNLFDNQEPSLSLLSELKRCAIMKGMATFFSGSAYHLIDGLDDQNFRLHDKMLIERMLPITLRAELAATQPLWHPSWTEPDEFPGLAGPALTAALERRIFLLTGGVLRSMLEHTKEQELAQCLVEPSSDSSALAVLALLYSVNRSALAIRAEQAAAAAEVAPGATAASIQAARQAASIFDPFQQASASMAEMRMAAGHDDDALTEATIRELADAGWLLLSDQQRGTFLRPKHFELMETVQHNLTLLERAAIRFPEGRTLGERWEVFYAEHLVEKNAVRWFDPNRPRHLELFQHGHTHSEVFFQTNAGAIFKPVPDNIGFDLLWWQIRMPSADEQQAAAEHPSKRAKKGKGAAASSSSAAPLAVQPPHVLEVHFIQVKVGKLKYDLSGSSLTEALRFADDPSQFENVQCGQMTGVAQDVAWNTALVTAAAAAAGDAAAPAPAHAKQYALEAHFHLVTSKHVSGPTKKILDSSAIGLALARDHSFWGPRVRQFCASPAAPFALFQ